MQATYFLCASIHYTPDYSQSCSPLHHFLSSSFSFLHPLWFRSLRHSLILMVILFYLLIPPHSAEDGQGTLQVQVCAQIFVHHVSLLHQKMLICYRGNMVQKHRCTFTNTHTQTRSNVCTRASSSNTILKYRFCLEKLKSVWKMLPPAGTKTHYRSTHTRDLKIPLNSWSEEEDPLAFWFFNWLNVTSNFIISGNW